MGRVKAVCRCAHEEENVPTEKNGNHRQNEPKQNAEENAVSDKLAKPFVITGTETAGNGNRETGTDAHAETDHEKVDGAGGTDACQSGDAKRPADDHGIDEIV